MPKNRREVLPLVFLHGFGHGFAKKKKMIYLLVFNVFLETLKKIERKCTSPSLKKKTWIWACPCEIQLGVT